jgi:hypothetical protein
MQQRVDADNKGKNVQRLESLRHAQPRNNVALGNGRFQVG